jgi:hypothetical protein
LIAGQPTNREGRNACIFDTIPVANRQQIALAHPQDDDRNNDAKICSVPDELGNSVVCITDKDCVIQGLGICASSGELLVDENVKPAGPIRNMSISKAGGPDMRHVLLEDLVGDTGNRMQAALGLMVLEGTPDLPATASFGVAVDDVVLEWREFELVPDQASCGPGEVKVLSPGNQGNGTIDIYYQPACESVDNTIVYGALANVGTLPAGYAGAVCGIGNTGSHLSFNPMAGSYFFLVVANDGGVVEGSYGQASGVERPPRPGNCSYVQDLTLRCD